MQMLKHTFSGVLAVLALAAATHVWAHGDVTPQPIDTTGLEPIKDSETTFLEKNPYSGNPKAIEIGKHAFGQNCARCHGIDAVSGGIAPDLREKLPLGDEGDEIFRERMVNGAVRNGVTYMPKFEGVVKQEGLWAIRSWLETVSVDAPKQADAAKPADSSASSSRTTSSSTTTTTSTTTTSDAAKPADTSSASTSTSSTPASSTSTSATASK